MTILIVDDSPANRAFLQNALRQVGYEDMLLASSGGEALQTFARSSIDLVLLDLVLPDVGGLTVCRALRATVAGREVPILVLTGSRDPDAVEAAFLAGATDFLAKPYRRAELLVRMRAALALKRETDRRKAREAELMEMTDQLRSVNERLERLSSADPLLGISNRRAFDNALQAEWERGCRDKRAISLVLCDVDHFKKYNDTYGHLRGDDCLRSIANVLVAQGRRPADLAARYGGEEFALLLPETDAAGAIAVAERVRKAVETLAIPHQASSTAPHVTISLGVATRRPAPGSGTADALIHAADLALYRSKHAGRNRVHLSGSAELSLIMPLGQPPVGSA